MNVIILDIDGMMCGQCEAHVKEMLEKIDGALEIQCSHLKRAAILHSPRPIGKEECEKALEGSGYLIVGYRAEKSDREGFFYRHKLKKYLQGKKA